MTDKERLRQYQDLLEAGAITEEEYNDMTKHLRERIQADEQSTDEPTEAPNSDDTPSASEDTADDSVIDETSATDEDVAESLSAETVELDETVSDEEESATNISDEEPTDQVVPEVLHPNDDHEIQPVVSQRPKRNYDMIIAVVVVLVVLIGGGIVVVKHNHQNAQIGTETTKKDMSKSDDTAAKSSKKATTKKDDSEKEKASSKQKKDSEKVAAQWSEDQTKKLADYMGVWQNAIGQTFVGTYNGDTPEHLTYKFPEALKEGKLDGHIKLDNEDVKFTWSAKADKKADYQVVAVATGSRRGSDKPTSYFFVIHDGQGVVYATETADGDDLELTKTQNADLQNNFAGIVDEKADDSSATSESQANITFDDDVTVSES
uniref:Putative lipoprotein n=1 Tax=Weissella thailandensis fsh4-2 TaxID=1056112 RepID=G0UFH2_9LACO|nr:putative lipoprotein [Weissella thailandensis fsh4-2]